MLKFSRKKLLLRTILLLSCMRNDGDCANTLIRQRSMVGTLNPAPRLQLSGGAPDDVNWEIALAPAESKSVTKGIPTELLPSLDNVLARHARKYFPDEVIVRLKSKAHNKTLTTDEGFVWNLLKMKKKLDRSRKKSRGSDSDCPINKTLANVRTEMEYLLEKIRVEDDAKKTAMLVQTQESLNERAMLLEQVQAELKNKQRYGKVKKVLKNDKGEVLAVIPKHSRWLDLIRDENLDDVARWELGFYDGETSRYTSEWDKKNMGRTLSLVNRRVVARDEHTANDANMGTVRAKKPIPPQGVHFFEVVAKIDGGADGESLGGGFYIGLVDGANQRWNGCWELIDEFGDRRKHFMALHDACNGQAGQVTWSGGLRKSWVEGSAYGHGDRIGVLVNMDTKTCNLYKNGRFLGKAFGDLPDKVYPMVTLTEPGTSAEICFPPFEDEVARERRQSELYVTHLASLPPKPEPLPSVFEMGVDPKKYRVPLIKELKTQLKELESKLEGLGWHLGTAWQWIRLHQCKFCLFLLGERPPPETRMISKDNVKLVMRGDGYHPPLTEEKDKKSGGAKGYRNELVRQLRKGGYIDEAGKGPAGTPLLLSRNVTLELLDNEKRGIVKEKEQEKEKEKEERKKNLPWSAYKKMKKGKIKKKDDSGSDFSISSMDTEEAEERFLEPEWEKHDKGPKLKLTEARNNARRARRSLINAAKSDTIEYPMSVLH
mmetsp:Transcript_33722/g.75772  ORF Transcript_33722/g.75772 Transcript_33722/m.75772 type:complete len:714 (-) Transcript_33722:35-2176(-)